MTAAAAQRAGMGLEVVASGSVDTAGPKAHAATPTAR